LRYPRARLCVNDVTRFGMSILKSSLNGLGGALRYPRARLCVNDVSASARQAGHGDGDWAR
jgi:hypothetical protein